MIQIAENEVFGPFLEFGASEQLDIAYFNRTKWRASLSHRISQQQQQQQQLKKQQQQQQQQQQEQQQQCDLLK